MGMLFSTLFQRLFGAKEHRILILGLDNAGKTTILYKLVTPDEVVRTMPTIGFNLESVTWKNVKLQVWDLGGILHHVQNVDILRADTMHALFHSYTIGQTNLRPYWRLYCKGIVSALIYVVDSADDERVNEARLALMTILEEEEMKSSALLVFANKQVGQRWY